MGDEREELTARIRAHACERQVWEAAESHLLEGVLRERLRLLRIEPSPDVAVALMAVAMLLAEHTPEFGGDARDVLGEVALLGLGLLGDEAGSAPGAGA